MKLENQVCSLELAKRLKELGVKQESVFKYCGGHTDYHDSDEGVFELCPNTDLLDDDEYCHTAEMTCEFTISAFTVAELGELLGTELTDANESDSYTLKCGNAIDFWWATFGNDEANITPQFENPSFANCLAELLIYLIENNLITL